MFSKIITILLISLLAYSLPIVLPNNITSVTLAPQKNACVWLDNEHIVTITKRGSEVRLAEAHKSEEVMHNVWIVVAYALDFILLFLLAYFFRLHLRNGGGSSRPSSSDGDHLPPTLLTSNFNKNKKFPQFTIEKV